MIIKVDEFKRLLQKATVNYSIESLQLNMDKDKIESKMISTGSDVIAILNVENDVLPDLKGPTEWNFNDPVQELLPYLNLIDGPETAVKASEEKIMLLTGKQASNIFFCSPQIVSVFGHTSPKANFPLVHKIELDEEFSNIFNKIKKIGTRFNKVYFGVDKGNFYIETTDKTNKFSNGFRVDLDKVKFTDMSLCIDYRNIVNLMTVIDGEDFTMEFFYVQEQKLGMLRASNADNSENYYLMSRKEV